MGRTQKPLTIIVVDRNLLESPEVEALSNKGHTITFLNIDQYEGDVIIGSKCWRIIPTMGKLSTYLDLMLAGVRAIKYPKV